MESCPYCRSKVAKSATFCPACGQELADYGHYFSRGEEPTTPEFWERAQHLGGPARRVMIAVMAVIFASIPMSYLLDGDIVTMLVFDVLFAIGILICAAPCRIEMTALVRFVPPGWLILGVFAAILMPLLADLYLLLLDAVFGIDLGEDDSSDLPVWLAVISICVFPGIFEELAFRGLMFGSLIHVLRRRSAHLLTAALFAAVHLSPAIFPYHLAVGLFLGWLRERSGSLAVPMAAHAAHNAAVIFLWTS